MATAPNPVQQIEQAIANLTREELYELYAWLDRHDFQQIDARIEADLSSGRLDKAILQALDDESHGRIQPL